MNIYVLFELIFVFYFKLIFDISSMYLCNILRIRELFTYPDKIINQLAVLSSFSNTFYYFIVIVESYILQNFEKLFFFYHHHFQHIHLYYCLSHSNSLIMHHQVFVFKFNIIIIF